MTTDKLNYKAQLGKHLTTTTSYSSIALRYVTVPVSETESYSLVTLVTVWFDLNWLLPNILPTAYIAYSLALLTIVELHITSNSSAINSLRISIQLHTILCQFM